MQRFIIITIILLLLLAAIFVGVGVVLTPSPITPPPVTQQKPLPAPTASVEVPESMRTEEAARSAYMQTLSPGDDTQVRQVSIAGDYALLVWSDGTMGGQALLKYNQTRSLWAVVTIIGGAFSVAGLRQEGLSQQLILALLHGLDI